VGGGCSSSSTAVAPSSFLPKHPHHNMSNVYGIPAGGSQPITVAYGGSTKPDIGSLASELESTLTNVAVSCIAFRACCML
jgi:hypothetical protein